MNQDNDKAVDLYYNNSQRLATTNEGILVSGGATITGNLSIGGTVTYEDVSNVDSIGVITARSGLNVTGASTFTGNIDVVSTDTGSSAAPELTLHRNSASPADADYLGQIKFTGKQDGGGTVNYAKITGKILDASNSTEDG
ncbi:MAG: hypothetical protein VXY93_22180, partial [Pseudomonadota bacterium]|nr:hypothetical protein [Pseudomonadota bacterium]